MEESRQRGRGDPRGTAAFTPDEGVWLGHCVVSSNLSERLPPEVQGGRTNWEVIRLHRQGAACVLQTLSSAASASVDDASIRIHPVLLDCLVQASASTNVAPVDNSSHSEPSSLSVRLDPLSISSVVPFQETGRCVVDGRRDGWTITSLMQEPLPAGSTLVIDLVYLDPEAPLDSNERVEHALAQALEGRWVMKQTFLVLSVRCCCAVAVVVKICRNDDAELDDPTVAFRAGRVSSFQVRIARQAHLLERESNVKEENENELVQCPGYEPVTSMLLDLLLLKGPSAPSGILLTGCHGVGKTRISSAVAQELRNHGRVVHYVSLNDILRHASWASEADLLDLFYCNTSDQGSVTILDRLDLVSMSGDAADTDAELRLVHNSLIQAMDRAVSHGNRLLGIARNAEHLTSDLVKASRLEKVVTVEPPTQIQRELILLHLLRELGVEAEQTVSWSERVACITGGCVAADLDRLCGDAWTRSVSRNNVESSALLWDDLRDAARSCVPSQLAALDVTKPMYTGESNSPGEWHKVHQTSWEPLAGCDELKRRVYRTIILPWRKFLTARDTAAEGSVPEPPTSGVLFHGPPGTGKTLASTCLGSSLGLPMIKIRASDVLDKYLGGSEAILRSIFSRARAAAPCILLLDEVDSLAGNRANDGEATGVMSRILSTLLNEMDGVSSSMRHPVLVVACTNRLETLDTALLRPGRLEEHVEFRLPNAKDAEAILSLYLQRLTVDKRDLFELYGVKLANKKATAAAIEGVAREAVLKAMRRLSTDTLSATIVPADIDDAMSALQL